MCPFAALKVWSYSISNKSQNRHLCCVYPVSVRWNCRSRWAVTALLGLLWTHTWLFINNHIILITSQRPWRRYCNVPNGLNAAIATVLMPLAPVAVCWCRCRWPLETWVVAVRSVAELPSQCHSRRVAWCACEGHRSGLARRVLPYSRVIFLEVVTISSYLFILFDLSNGHL